MEMDEIFQKIITTICQRNENEGGLINHGVLCTIVHQLMPPPATSKARKHVREEFYKHLPRGWKRIGQKEKRFIRVPVGFKVSQPRNKRAHDVFTCHECGSDGFCDKHDQFDLDRCHNRGNGKYHWNVTKYPTFYRYYRNYKKENRP